jgi:zinc/manganese transport system substrate-binding protein
MRLIIIFLQRGARRLVVLLLGLAVALAGCSASGSDDSDTGLTVVATTTILGDLAHNIVGDHGTVEVLLPTGADPHDYQPSAQQVAAMQRADLVVANGLGLEEGLADVLAGVRDDGTTVLEVAPLVNPIPFGSGGDTEDPHVWFDPLRMADAAVLVSDQLTAIDGSVDWASAAEAYGSALAIADVEIQTILSAVAEPNRRLVTNHDALEYFAQRYGFEVVGTVIPGGATLADPSSAELAAVVSEIQRLGVPAIFAETTEPAVLADAVAAEVGGDIEVVLLYTGSLGEPGSGADTLIDMLLTNARRIADALS